IILLFAMFLFFSFIKYLVMPSVTVFSFGAMFVIICVVFNGVFLLLFGRTEEFKYLFHIIKNKLR
ncbi:MAG: hypothetical protein K2G39_13490, partial [Lachnospiraceae bacterium]|nr:hypothetical protein [Lachnospiraceae bacterium]